MGPIDCPPKIDGQIDDICWKKAAHLDDFLLLSSGQKPSERTEAWIGYDQTHFYLAARMHCEDPKKLSAKIKDRDGPVFEDDDFELFLDSANDGDSFYQFAVNSAGTRHDRRRWLDPVAATMNERIDWNGQWKVQTAVDSNGWNVEMAVPFVDIQFSPHPGNIMGIQLARASPSRKEWSCWTATERFPNAMNFGVLCFRSRIASSASIKNVRFARFLDHIPTSLWFDLECRASSKMEGDLHAVVIGPYRQRYEKLGKFLAEKWPIQWEFDFERESLPSGRYKVICVLDAKEKGVAQPYLGYVDLQIPSPVHYGDMIFCPAVKSVVWKKREFSFHGNESVHIRKNASAHEQQLAGDFSDEIFGFCGQRLPVKRLEFSSKIPVLMVCEKTPTQSDVDRLLGKLGSLKQKEAYCLFFSENAIGIGGIAVEGVGHGTVTAGQLMKRSSLLEKDAIPGVEILDWPDIDCRMVWHWLGTGPNWRPEFAYDDYLKEIKRLLAGAKINSYTVDFQDYIALQNAQNQKAVNRHPLLTITEYGALADFCRRQFVGFFPCLPSGSYSWWMTRAWPELKEKNKSGSGFQADVLHPDFYARLFPVMDELIDAAKPAFFCINQDEWWGYGDRESWPKPKHEIFLGHILKVYNHLKGRGIRTAMMSDQLLRDHGGGQFGDGYEVMMAKMPKDILILNWSYPFLKSSIKELTQRGFSVAQLQNGFSPVASGDKKLICAYGTLTANPFFMFNKNAGQYQIRSFHQILRCADYGWNLFHDKELPSEEWVRLYGHNITSMCSVRPNPAGSHEFSIVDLTPYCHRGGSTNDELAGFSLPGMTPGRQTMGFIPVSISKSEKNGCAWVAGTMDGVKIPIHRKFSSLLFFHTAFLGAKEKAFFADTQWKCGIGSYEMLYDDASTEKIRMVFNRNIHSWRPDPPLSRYLIDARYVWEGITPQRELRCAYLYEWVNPHPEKTIDSVLVKSNGTPAKPILVSLSGRLPHSEVAFKTGSTERFKSPSKNLQ
ncbi:MAG: sugar-binding protein [Verrucomicrobiae bacterium]|nr:sugar-binding protein [Verrucomicrobiae bacterium]